MVEDGAECDIDVQSNVLPHYFPGLFVPHLVLTEHLHVLINHRRRVVSTQNVLLEL